jgi:hypothetical protein
MARRKPGDRSSVGKKRRTRADERLIQVTERLKFAELAVAETKKLRLDLTTRSGAEGRYAVGAVAGNMAASTAGQELRCAVKWVDAYKMILMENELDLSAGAPFVHSTHASGWTLGESGLPRQSVDGSRLGPLSNYQTR